MAITVDRKPLTFWEKLYLPAIIGGIKVTTKHAWNTLIKGKVVTMEFSGSSGNSKGTYHAVVGFAAQEGIQLIG